ncbi:MAG: sulfite exporter TauE/SafE family protein [Candidatus Caenarcaniphilales bacterium]|nr:sulfite exporter TauE/SafE family protein [Candidatus Caenarcaniphilales bacterium]
MIQIFLCVLIGLGAGVFSGLIGIGGGLIIIPALVYILGFSQQMAQGTTLAVLIPPIGILAAWTYYQKGLIDIKVAALICLGFVVGGWVGSKLAVSLSNALLQRIFALVMLCLSVRMLLFPAK